MSTESASASRIRRSRRKQQVNPLQHPDLGRYIFLAMTALAGVYILLAVYHVRQAAASYGMLAPGMSRTDTRYMIGPPVAVRNGDGPWQPVTAGIDPMGFNGWRYAEPGGGTTLATFDGADMLTRLECFNQAAVAGTCPETLGLGIGSDEGSVLFRLGAPDRQHYSGDAKIISYDGLGLTFTLRRLTVVSISLSRHPGFMTYLGRAIRYVVP